MFHPFIHLSINPQNHSLNFSPLISLPILWLVFLVSVRPVISAVSSLGKNKVLLCSRHYKRKGEMKGRIQKEGAERGRFLKRRGVNWKKSSKLGTRLFMPAVIHCHVWVITTIDFSRFVIPFICTAQSLQLVWTIWALSLCTSSAFSPYYKYISC